MRKILEHMEAMANQHGASLKYPSTLRAMSIEASAKNDFSRGVLATLAEVSVLASQCPEARQSILDLGFQPVLENVEGE